MQKIRNYLRYYKKSLLWINFGVISIMLLFGVHYFLTNYDNIDFVYRTPVTLFLIGSFSFILVFFIFSFVKFYKNGKHEIELLLDRNSLDISHWVLFTVIAISINIDIVLLLKTGAFDYVFTLVPPTKIFLESYFGTLDKAEMGSIFTDYFDQNLIFRLIISAFGSGVLVFLKNIRQLNVNEKPKMYPGTRILMIFFFLSILGIFVSTVSNPPNDITITSLVTIITNIIILSSMMSFGIFLMDNLVISRIRSLL